MAHRESKALPPGWSLMRAHATTAVSPPETTLILPHPASSCLNTTPPIHPCARDGSTTGCASCLPGAAWDLPAEAALAMTSPLSRCETFRPSHPQVLDQAAHYPFRLMHAFANHRLDQMHDAAHLTLTPTHRATRDCPVVQPVS